MKSSIVAICVGGILLAPALSYAECRPLTAGELELIPSTWDARIGIPPFYGEVNYWGPASYVLGQFYSPIHLIAPPQMLNPADNYVVGIDYGGCFDSTAWTGEFSYSSPGSYLTTTSRVEEGVLFVIVNIATKNLGACWAQGGAKEFVFPSPAKSYEGADVANPPDFANQESVNSLTDLVNKVTVDAGGGMIDLVFAGAGCEGSITVNGVDEVSLLPADADNFTKFCSLRGKVGSVRLLSSSTGHGTSGSSFLEALSACLGGVPVTGYTGAVKSFSRNGRRRWACYGGAVTKTAPVPALPTTWGKLKSTFR